MTQEKLFESETDWQKEWKDMPEYANENIEPFKSIKIHFRNKEDYFEFSKLIKQNLSKKTLSIWFPVLEKSEFSKLRYTDES